MDAGSQEHVASRDGRVQSVEFPFFRSPVACGFPSPAEEYLEERIDIGKYLVRNELSTFFVFARGKSMIDADIADGALLVVDRSIDYRASSKFLCYYEDGFTVKFVRKRGERIFLCGSKDHPEIEVVEGVNFQIWGTVTYSINPHYQW